MCARSINKTVGFSEAVFDVQKEHMPHGAWWWWFWLFFFENPDDPQRPRQLMILWSTKNVRETAINGMNAVFDHPQPREVLDVVAAWYYDGKKMHHNYVLEQCDIRIGDAGIESRSEVPTSFLIDGNTSTIKVGDMEFIVDHPEDTEHSRATYSDSSLFGNWGYKIIRLNKGGLVAKVDGQESSGTAYFQRVFVNSPGVAPWYWGIFHFENGGELQYFMPYFMGKAFKRDVTYFDGKERHKFRDIEVDRVEGDLPEFRISASDGERSISFIVAPYSHSAWEFVSRPLKLFSPKLVYNEYPATIRDFIFEDKARGIRATGEDTGLGVGNAEHTTGMLL